MPPPTMTTWAWPGSFALMGRSLAVTFELCRATHTALDSQVELKPFERDLIAARGAKTVIALVQPAERGFDPVHAALAPSLPTYDEMWHVAREYLLSREYVGEGARVVATAGVPSDVSGTTNLLKVEVV